MLTLLFDPIDGVFNLRFMIAALAANMMGFGLVYLGWAGELKIKARPFWFYHGTVALVVFMAGLSVFVSLP